MGAAEGQSDTAKGRRVIPRLWMTVVWCAFWVAGGIFLGVAVTFGNVDGGVVLYLVLSVIVASCFAWAGLMVWIGSFFVKDHQVRSGWPRSRWIHSEAVEVVRPEVNPGLTSISAPAPASAKPRSERVAVACLLFADRLERLDLFSGLLLD